MKDTTGREYSYAELEHKIDELEDCISANDDMTQVIVQENVELCNRLEAVEKKLTDLTAVRYPRLFATERDYYIPEIYFERYKKYGKHDLIMEIMHMKLKGLGFTETLPSKTHMQTSEPPEPSD